MLRCAGLSGTAPGLTAALPAGSWALACFSPAPGVADEEPATDEVVPGPLRQRLQGFVNSTLAMLQRGAGRLTPPSKQLRLSYCCLERIIWKLAVNREM